MNRADIQREIRMHRENAIEIFNRAKRDDRPFSASEQQRYDRAISQIKQLKSQVGAE